MIRTIPMLKMVMEVRGILIALFVLATLPPFLGCCAWLFVKGLQDGDIRQTIVGFIATAFFGFCTIIFAPSKKYVPGKTFSFYRSEKIKKKKYINYAYLVTVLIFSVLVAVSPKEALEAIVGGLVAVCGIYSYSKSLKFHSDVDFSTNEYLVTALGFSAEEKILLSYQNFDAEEFEAGSNAFAATATKLIVASFDGSDWTKQSNDLNQLSGIGIIGKDSESYAVKLEFNDGVDVWLYIGLYNKLTSNPLMVIRGLLEAIDASVLCDSGAPQAAKRRRVVVNTDTSNPIPENVPADVPLAVGAPARNIEVVPDVLNAIRNAEKTVSGRRLEI